MSDIRLYSSFDVESVLAKKRHTAEWPPSVVSVQVFHDVLRLAVQSESQFEEAHKALDMAFGAHYNANAEKIILESVAEGDATRYLPVEIEVEADATPYQPKIRPSFARVSSLPDEPNSDHVALPPPFESDSPTVMAFYSYKGGVGRTTHLVAALKSLLERKADRPSILLIDADLEAPGLTWWGNQQNGEALISFLDLLALKHHAQEEDAEYLTLAVHRIQEQILTLTTDEGKVDLFFLPAFRYKEQLFRMSLRPEHLVQRGGNAWVIGDLLVQLGRKLGVGLVMVDLRAGVSELASPLLFDPRIRRVVVTTASRQSIEGTKWTLQQMCKLSHRNVPAETPYFDPTIILSMIPEKLAAAEVDRCTSELYAALPDFLDDDDISPRIPIESSTFAEQLLHADSLLQFLRTLTSSPPHRLMERLMQEWMPPRPDSQALMSSSEKNKARERLAEVAESFVVAETTRTTDFLRTGSLKSLGSRFQHEPPLAVVMGAKGSGKTYSYQQIVVRQTWSKFLNELGLTSSTSWGHICPLTTSLNVDSFGLVDSCQHSTLKEIGTGTGLSRTEIKSSIDDKLKDKEATESDWATFWLNLISRSLGLGEAHDRPALHLQAALKERDKQVVAILDGLEELFHAYNDPKLPHAIALRSLLQDVPNALRDIPNRRLGLLVFIRKDIARAVLPQNFVQFESLYARYELKWNPTEALRLAAWICARADLNSLFHSLGGDRETVLATASRETLEQVLSGLWGLKMGSPKSREAWTVNWVVGVLSDLKGQLQARDIVRFLHHAAAKAIGKEEYDERLLHPSALRDAIADTSREKIEDIEKEITGLKAIFQKFRKVPNRAIPFVPNEFHLTPSDVKFLEEVGIAVPSEGQYYLAESFRQGLGFQYKRKARPKVLSLMWEYLESRST